MKRLILVRHAKSSWSQPGLSDHSRPLNGRGRRSAKVIGQWLARHGFQPDEVLSSDSQRTRETWHHMSPSFDAPPEPNWRKQLYHAWPETMLAELQAAEGSCVLILGHNPGCAYFAEQIVKSAPTHPRFQNYPTAATLVADLSINRWQDANWGMATPVKFVVPRDLLES